MTNMLLKLFMTTGLLFLAGCGHNVIVYGDGVQAEAGFIPDQYKISFTFRYGKILTACVRENTEIEMEGEGSADSDENQKPINAGSKDKLKIKIGNQITGYYVDSIKASSNHQETIKK